MNESRYYDKGYNGKYTDESWWQGRYKEKADKSSSNAISDAINGASDSAAKKVGKEASKSANATTVANASSLATTGLTVAAGIVGANSQRADPEAPASVGEQTLTMAASGAALGTSILPGWGTAIGAVVGGAYGAINGTLEEDDYQKKLLDRKAQKDEEQYLYGRGLRRAMKAKAYEMYVA